MNEIQSPAGEMAGAASHTAFPWPPPPDRPLLDALAETWRASLFEPRDFFARMPVRGPLGAALLYFLVVGVAAQGVRLFWSIIRDVLLAGTAAGPGVIAGKGADPAELLLGFLLSPLTLLALLLTATVVVHATLLVLGAASASIGATLRVLAYTHGAALFEAVPLAGSILAFAWMIVAAARGLATVHATGTARAVLALLLPLAGAAALYLISMMVTLLESIPGG